MGRFVSLKNPPGCREGTEEASEDRLRVAADRPVLPELSGEGSRQTWAVAAH